MATRFGEFGGERDNGIAYESCELWAVFSSDEPGPPLATGRTEASAVAAYTSKREGQDPGEGANDARADFERGNVFVARCAFAWAFDNKGDRDPSPDWITGAAVAEAVAAERAAAVEIARRVASAAVARKSGYRTEDPGYWDADACEETAREIADAIEARSKGEVSR